MSESSDAYYNEETLKKGKKQGNEIKAWYLF